jgi:hypothetical protein
LNCVDGASQKATAITFHKHVGQKKKKKKKVALTVTSQLSRFSYTGGFMLSL